RPSQEPGRATGEPLCIQGGRLTPRTPALRATHSRACHHDKAQRHTRYRADAAEPSTAPPSRAFPGPFEEVPDNHLTPTAKRTRYALVGGRWASRPCRYRTV